MLLGIALRFYGLESLPPGLNNDEAIFGYYGLYHLSRGEFCLFARGGLRWDALFCYYYGFVAHQFGNNVLSIRIPSAVLSALLIVMFYLLGRTLWDRHVGLVSAALAGGAFLLIYYGRMGISGAHVLLLDCVALYFLLLFFQRKKLRWLIPCFLFSLIGLMTYATFRVIEAFFFIACILLGAGMKQKICGLIGSFFAPLAAYVGMVLWVEGSTSPILKRGAYNINRPEFSAAENYMRTFLLFFKRLPNEFGIQSSKFLSDGFHLLIFDSFPRPEGTLLSMLMVASLAVSLYFCYRSMRQKRYGDPVILMLIFTLLYFLVVGYAGPSYSRMLGILIPLILLTGFVLCRTVEWLSGMGPFVRVAGGALMLVLAAAVLGEGVLRLRRLGVDNPRALFLHDWNAMKLAEKARERSALQERVMLFSTFGLDVMNYLMFDFPYHDSYINYDIENVRKYGGENRPKRLYVLIEGAPAENLVNYVKINYQGVQSEEFHMPETKMDFVELYVPAGSAMPVTEEKASSSRARKISEGGMREGPGKFNEPRAIAIDAKGNLYVADFRNYRIQKLDKNGAFLIAWGGQGSEPGQFNDPCGIAIDARRNVYVADTFNHRIQIFDGGGKFISQFKGGFFAPHGIAIDRKGRIWIADSGNGVIKLFSRDGTPLKVVGRKGSGEGEFESPIGLAVDKEERIYVADAGNRRVQILDGEGNYVREFKVDGWRQGVFNEPYLDVDDGGDIYLTDPLGHRALRYSKNGELTGTLKPFDGGNPLLQFPMGIAVEKRGIALFIVDCHNHLIRKFSKQDFK